MDEELADKVIEFILKKSVYSSGKIIVNYHGGEPMLNFKIIKYITNKLKKKVNNERLMFGSTTNGVLLNNEIINFICENFDWNLSLSLDGDRIANECNRFYGKYSNLYDNVIENASKILNQRPDLRIRATYTKESLKRLHINIKFFLEKGFNNIVIHPDIYDDWNDEDIDLIEQQFNTVKDMYLLVKKEKPNLMINICDIKLKKKGRCNGGINEFNISSKGDIYCCTYLVGNEKFMIGNVDSGIDNDKVSYLLKKYNEPVKKCEGCSVYSACDSVRCQFVNFAVSGIRDEPILINCMINNIIAKEY